MGSCALRVRTQLSVRLLAAIAACARRTGDGKLTPLGRQDCYGSPHASETPPLRTAGSPARTSVPVPVRSGGLGSDVNRARRRGTAVQSSRGRRCVAGLDSGRRAFLLRQRQNLARHCVPAISDGRCLSPVPSSGRIICGISMTRPERATARGPWPSHPMNLRLPNRSTFSSAEEVAPSSFWRFRGRPPAGGCRPATAVRSGSSPDLTSSSAK
jgi:hypothetical protein